jgi:hypothetical protein
LSLLVPSEFVIFSIHITIFISFSCFAFYCFFHLLQVLTIYDSIFDTLSLFRILHRYIFYRDFHIVFVFCFLLFISVDPILNSLQFYFCHSVFIPTFLSFHFLSLFFGIGFVFCCLLFIPFDTSPDFLRFHLWHSFFIPNSSPLDFLSWFSYRFRVLIFIVYFIWYQSWLSWILLLPLFLRSEFFIFSFQIQILVLLSCFLLYCLFHLILVLTLYYSTFDTLSSFRIFHLFISYPDFDIGIILCRVLFILFNASTDALRFYVLHSFCVLNFLSCHFLFLVFGIVFVFCRLLFIPFDSSPDSLRFYVWHSFFVPNCSPV